MVGTVLDLDQILAGQIDNAARMISQKYIEWNTFRNQWMQEKQELRNYLFATDTTKTSNSSLPWKNSTTLPKLTQIRDNLHANYMEALFPHSEWLQWEGDRQDDEMEGKRQAIQGYMSTKLRQDAATVIVGQLLLDYIDYGNCFATVKWVDDSVTGPDGTVTRGYVGPRFVRISPYDIVFNPTAPTFAESPKIIRSVQTLGDLKKMALGMNPDTDEYKTFQAAMNKTVNIRKQVAALGYGDTFKSQAYQIDGFSSIQNYYKSDYVDILTFYGDMYDLDNDKFYQNHVFSVIDRSFVISHHPNPNWTTHGGFFHAGWRQRPDNLYAMGPLDNLVGMQYRIDHLENLKADIFDLIAYPQKKVKGFVQDWVDQPGERIYIGEDGDVEYLHPDTTALQADMQIDKLEMRMEEMAGAPKEAMGIRTPGEKTKFEVQILDNAASRIFLNKIRHFEQIFFEPLLNFALQVSRQNMSGADVARTLDSEIDAVTFTTVTKDDITANGILRAQGATHFAYRANVLQNVIQLMNSAVAQDPQVKIHLSGKKTAKLIEELADLDQYKIYGDNIRVFEFQETNRLQQAGNDQTQVQGQTPPNILPHDNNAAQISPDQKFLPQRLHEGAPVGPPAPQGPPQ